METLEGHDPSLVQFYRYKCGNCSMILISPYTWITIENKPYIQCTRCSSVNRVAIPNKQTQLELEQKAVENQRFQQRIKKKKQLVVANPYFSQTFAPKVPPPKPRWHFVSSLYTHRQLQWESIAKYPSKNIFSRKKSSLLKKAYQVARSSINIDILFLLCHEGNIFTFATPRFRPIIAGEEGKNLIREFLSQDISTSEFLHQETHSPSSLKEICISFISSRPQDVRRALERTTSIDIIQRLLVEVDGNISEEYLDFCRLGIPGWTLMDEEAMINSRIRKLSLTHFTRCRYALFQKIYEILKLTNSEVLLLLSQDGKLVEKFATPRLTHFFSHPDSQLLMSTALAAPLEEMHLPEEFSSLPRPFHVPKLQVKHFRKLKSFEDEIFRLFAQTAQESEESLERLNSVSTRRVSLLTNLQQELDQHVGRLELQSLQVCFSCAAHFDPIVNHPCRFCQGSHFLCEFCLEILPCSLCTASTCGYCRLSICSDCEDVRVCVTCETSPLITRCGLCLSNLCTQCSRRHSHTNSYHPEQSGLS